VGDPLVDPISSLEINWDSDLTRVMMNPRLDQTARDHQDLLFAKAPELRGHLWVQSSGSSNQAGHSAKWIALAKSAFLASAQGVNSHLGSLSQDIWGLALPLFHVSGLAILARAHLSGAQVQIWEQSWRPGIFLDWLEQKQITLVSLVPTQLFDLVKLNRPRPPHLRAAILGGAKLEESLYLEATKCGWPVLPSYGMTEFCSQLATARLHHPELIILPHVQARVDAEKYLWIKSKALYTGSLQLRGGKVEWETPRTLDGFWQSADRAEIAGSVLDPLGRASEFIKILGEGVDLQNLRSRFLQRFVSEFPALSPDSYAITALPDSRRGHLLICAFEAASSEIQGLILNWNQESFPPERLQARAVPRIPRSPLGKVLWGELNHYF